jgi:hypothetical protein
MWSFSDETHVRNRHLKTVTLCQNKFCMNSSFFCCLSVMWNVSNRMNSISRHKINNSDPYQLCNNSFVIWPFQKWVEFPYVWLIRQRMSVYLSVCLSTYIPNYLSVCHPNDQLISPTIFILVFGLNIPLKLLWQKLPVILHLPSPMDRYYATGLSVTFFGWAHPFVTFNNCLHDRGLQYILDLSYQIWTFLLTYSTDISNSTFQEESHHILSHPKENKIFSSCCVLCHCYCYFWSTGWCWIVGLLKAL